MPKAPRMAQQKHKLSVSDRLARLRAVVEDIPDGDQDKEDLMLLFGELDRVKRLHRAIKDRSKERRHVREENRRLRGALSLAKFALKEYDRKVMEQGISIKWLCRRLKQNKLQDFERKEIQSILGRGRWEKESVTSSISPQT